jgi:hypothetical protein
LPKIVQAVEALAARLDAHLARTGFHPSGQLNSPTGLSFFLAGVIYDSVIHRHGRI